MSPDASSGANNGWGTPMPLDRRTFTQGSVSVIGAALAGGTSASAQEANRMYAEPFIDKDEWRDAPVRHRYVHGGFKGTELLFSLYFPEKQNYGGRFFQPLQAISGNENSAPMAMYQASGVGFALAS